MLTMNTLLYDLGDICEKHGIFNVSGIPFEKNTGYIEVERREFLDILTEVYHAGMKFEKERKFYDR